MNATEAIDKIVNLLGLKFNQQKFFTTKLDDNSTEVTNNLDEDLQVGQTLYVVGESTLSPASPGEHKTREGLVLILDEESTIVEIKTEEEVEEVVEEEVEAGITEEMAETETDEMEKFKEAITEILSLINSMNGNFKSQINELKNELEKFKNSPERKPIEKKANFKENLDEYKIDFLRQLRGK